MSMLNLSTQVSDTSFGQPAAGVSIKFFFKLLIKSTPNADDRTNELLNHSETIQTRDEEVLFHIGFYMIGSNFASFKPYSNDSPFLYLVLYDLLSKK